MKFILNSLKINRIGNTELFVFFTALLGSALFWSYFLISVSSIFIAFLVLFECQLYPGFRIQFRKSFIATLKELSSQPLLLSFVLLFLLGIASYFWSENLEYWNKYNRVRLQLLIIPVSLLFHKEVPRIYLKWILKMFIAAGVICTFIVLYYYIKNHELYIYAIKFGKPYYTLVQHIRFTALLVMAFGSCIYLLKDCQSFYSRFLYIGTAFLFFVMIHLLAVKGSILSLYIVCVFALFFLLPKIRNKWTVRSIPVILVLTLTLSIFWVPGLKHKLDYVKFEISEFKQGRWQNLSDIERLVSYKAGYDIAMKHPILGVGLGDFEDETAAYYKTHWNLDRFTLPHNEILFQYMSLGVGGLILLLSIYYNTIRERIFRTDFLCQAFIISILMLQMFNDTFESQISVAMTVFVLIVLWVIKGHSEAVNAVNAVK